MQNDAALEKQKDVLLEINKLAISGSDFSSVMNKVVEGVLAVLPQAHGAIVELCDDNEMVYVAASGSMVQHVGLRLKIAGSLSGQCATEEKQLYCSDTETDPRVDRYACLRLGIRSMIVSPLLYQKESIGVLKVYSNKPDVFNITDQIITQFFVTMISAGLGSVVETQRTENMSEFLNIVSHELRTPLTSLNGALKIISGLHNEDLLPENTQKLLDVALRSSERMLLLINDLLTASKIDAGKMFFSLKEESLDEMLSEALGEMASYRNNISFVLETFTSDIKIKVDRNRFLQILTNLLSNAARFSHEGGQVFVSSKLSDGKVLISVEDKGIGISKAFQTRIFQKFAQAQAQTHQGTGLGLNITKDLVERMGGRIWFKSEEGSGTVFYIEFSALI